ncbi:MAG: nucleotidyltransferase family protein [Thermodesulfobacteriota bacterium]
MASDLERMAGIILAAGESRRMGHAKQLLSAGSETLLVRVLRETLDSALDEVVLVLGHRAERIRESLGSIQGHPKLKIVLNPRYREGMSTSLIAGLTRVEKQCGRVMVILGDIPHVSAGLIDRLRREAEASNRPLGAVAVCGRRSHPVVIGREFYGAIHGLTGDRGARDLFQERSDLVCLVEAGETYDASDIDTPEDYDRFRKPGPKESASGDS